jgi:tol-pal system protein YbgF
MKLKAAVQGAVMLGVLTSGMACAADPIPVVDASPGSPGPAASTGQHNLSVSPQALSQVRDSGPSNAADMLYQLEQLQQEVQQLRGIVEEQAHQIDSMREEQRDRYLDLDRRISLLSQTAPQPAPVIQPAETVKAPAKTPTATTQAKPSESKPSEPVAAAAAKGNEKEAYQSAFAMVRNRQYDKAAVAFEQLIKDYPNGSYTGNAYYWLGEVLIVESKPEEALKAFGALLSQYPEHRKAPDAKYKQGKIYLQLGDKARGKELLQSVVDQHAGSSAAKLAEAEIREAQL